MRIPIFWLNRLRPASLDGQEAVRSVYSKFRRIQKLNTRMLERMAEMERALGGEYIFDRAFLQSSVRTLSADAYQVVYSLNALSDNRYVELFDRHQSIKGTVEDILSGGLGPYSGRMALPYGLLGFEMEPLVGTLNVCLSETRQHLGLSAPDGFAVTVTGCRRFFEHNNLFERLRETGTPLEGLFAEAELPDALRRAIERETRALQERRGSEGRFSVRASAAGGYGLVQPELRGITEVPAEDIPSACKLALAEYVVRLGEEERDRIDEISVALSVHESTPVRVTGSVSALGPAGSPSSFIAIEAAPSGYPDRCERYLLGRVYPFDLLEME
ncbi:MAG: PEP/pyruvate-binding domain-containing protein, partial [Acidobacteriota bacterium]